MYIMSDATTALLSLPRLISQSPRRSLITVTRNRFSVSSSIQEEMSQIVDHFFTVKIILIEAVQPKGKRLATRSSEDDILHIRTLSVEKTHYTLQLF